MCRIFELSGVVAQLVRAPACHAGGRGFESRLSRQKSRDFYRKIAAFLAGAESFIGSLKPCDMKDKMSIRMQCLLWLEAARPKTLPAAVAPVLLGSAMADADGGFQWLPALLCLAFALLIQIGTNLANDYLDGVKGTDTEARLGPRRLVASGRIPPLSMKWAAIGILALAFFPGLSLLAWGSYRLLVVGIASVICAWAYTGGPYPLAYKGLGDLFVIIFFGLIAVGCTYYVQVGTTTVNVWLLGISCGLVVNNILVVNNYRDFEEDRQAGKRTLVVLLGRRRALVQYGLSLLLSGLILLWLVEKGGYSRRVLLAWLPLLWGCGLIRRLSSAGTSEAYRTVLAGTTGVVCLFAALVAFALF